MSESNAGDQQPIVVLVLLPGGAAEAMRYASGLVPFAREASDFLGAAVQVCTVSEPSGMTDWDADVATLRRLARRFVGAQ